MDEQPVLLHNQQVEIAVKDFIMKWHKNAPTNCPESLSAIGSTLILSEHLVFGFYNVLESLQI